MILIFLSAVVLKIEKFSIIRFVQQKISFGKENNKCYIKKMIIKFYKRLKQAYYEGPDWIILPSFVKEGNYRSPTVLGLAWLYALHLRILTLPGRVILPVEFLTLTYSLFLLSNQVKVLAFGLLSLTLTDLVLGFVFRPRKLSVLRFTPERASADVPFEIIYEIKNEGKLPLWNLCVDPFPFFLIRGDDEELKGIPSLMPGEKIVFSVFRTAKERGAYSLYRPIVESTFPFSIFKWSKRFGKASKIVVHPNFESLSSINIFPGQNYQIEGNTQVSKTGDSTDFIGCREFRTGDNPRHIHWPSSARRGELVVREFQEEHLTRTAFIIDRFLPDVETISDLFGRKRLMQKRKFEALVKLSASIVDKISRSEFLLDIFISGRNVYHIEGSRTKIKFDYLLDVISCMTRDHLEPASELPKDILDILSSVGSVVVIFLKWDKSRQKLYNQLRDNGIMLKAIIITEEESSELPDYIQLIDVEAILNGQIKHL